MTPFASVALFQRGRAVVFKPPRKERPADLTQARKSAFRYWRNMQTTTDRLLKVIVLREIGGGVEISERCDSRSEDRPWIMHRQNVAGVTEDHMLACLAELGVTAEPAAFVPPDVLTINGFTYRREI